MTDLSQRPHGPYTFADKIFGINPYSNDDPQHETWESNARLAAEEEATFEAELLKTTPVTPEECARYVQDGMVGHFDILARRVLIFKFRTAESIAIYQELLTGMMESMLTLVGDNCSPMIPKAPFLFVLQRQFRQRIAHWTAEALKRMREGIATDRVSQSEASGEQGLTPGNQGVGTITHGIEQGPDNPTAPPNRSASAVKEIAPASAYSTEKPLEPSEGTRADQEVSKDAIRITDLKKKRGPQANMEFHRAVAEVVRSFGPNWKERLEEIAEDMKRRKIRPLEKWATSERAARSWARAVECYPERVVKALEYSLKMAARDITEKPSEPSENSR